MNKQQQIAAAWLPLIQAAAEGKTFQRLRIKQGTNEEVWCDVDVDIDELNISIPPGIHRIRIKPEPKKEWVRIGLWTAEGHCPRFYANALNPEEIWERNKYFGGWLTERIEYELPEGK